MLWHTYRVAALVLLSALSKGQLPEDDFRIIHRQDLLAVDTDLFEDNSSRSFSQLSFDVARDQLIVGARDALYRLSLRGLRPLERASWPADPNKVEKCLEKGQTEEDCHNYIKVLLPYEHRIFVCGTNAFSPECGWREIESIRNASERSTGVASCPHNPRSNVTAILASGGEYYAGTPTDFSSSDTAICRSRGSGPHNVTMLRTTQYDQNSLNEPQFVGSFEDENYVYFVFREIAVEFMNCGKIIYSRIARVCKNDSGGHYLRKNNWSTFLKARLKCAVHGDVPFHYDEVQAVEYLSQEKILVAAFTTPVNSITGSAVCVYSLADIHEAFEGMFKVQDSPTSSWEPRAPDAEAREHFRCAAVNRPPQSIGYLDYHLMNNPILPISGEPIYKLNSERLTQVTADVTTTKDVTRQFVVYASTQSGDVMKLSVLPRFDGACLVEVWRLGVDVLRMQFVKDTMSVYLGTDKGVMRIGSERCGRYRTRSGCVGAGDPHCGWEETRDRCVRAAEHLKEPRFAQATAACVTSSAVVDGGWSSWSEWQKCVQDGTSRTVYGDEKPEDMCLCRTRMCNNPAPANGGEPCKGVSISVTNCTVHGGWSAWGGWSECSATCGIAIKSRRRTCTSPAPKFDGRVCVGPDADHMYCSNLPPCPDPTRMPVDGGWSDWSPWSECQPVISGSECGAGYRERRRTCSHPAPKHGGQPCDGNSRERQHCDLQPCGHHRKATAWSPWVQIPDNSSEGDYSEKRFKFLCKTSSSEQLELSISREEVRYCSGSGSCGSSPSADGWSSWSTWSDCSAPCGGGQQRRRRRCVRPPCVGASDMQRACNTHKCASSQWSCWSEWSECSGGCAGGRVMGHRNRTRACLSSDGCEDAAAALERRPCVSHCESSEVGWGDWGEWSPCSNGERTRRRSCSSGACVGAQMQVAPCDNNDLDNELYALPAYSQSVEMASFVNSRDDSMGVPSVVGFVIASFCAGTLVCLAAVIFFQRRGTYLPCRRQHRVPSSPHYITAKPNSYVSVPLKEVPRKAKRQPSFTGISGASGILLSKSNNLSANNHNVATATPKLYPKAIANEYDSMGTLKRHSNQPNNRSNLDLEEDKFY